MNLVGALYGDWIDRLCSSDRPLSEVERTGYLAVDYMIRMETGAIDRLVHGEPGETGETVDALRVLGLDGYADDLKRVIAGSGDPEDLEVALSELVDTFDGRLEFEAAVANYVRGASS